MVTVTLRDAQGNVVFDAGDVVEVFASRGVVGGVTDNGDGTYSASVTSSTVAGVAVVSFAVGGVVSGNTVEVAFVAGAVDANASSVVAVPVSVVADGVAGSVVTVTLRDAQGNAVGVSAGVVGISSTRGVVGGVTDHGDGTYSASVTSVVAGAATVSFAVDGVVSGNTVGVEFVPGPADANASTITATRAIIEADGVSSANLIVTVRDQFGNLVINGANTITLDTTLGDLGNTVDNGNGTWTTTLTSRTSGVASVGFAINGTQSPSRASVIVLPGAPSPATSTISAFPGTATSDGLDSARIVVTIRDANGNLAKSGVLVNLRTTLGTLTQIEDHGDGTWSSLLTSTVSGNAVVTFTVNGQVAADDVSVMFVAGAADATRSQITADPHQITADGTSTSTVALVLKDAHGNRVTAGGQSVVMQTTAGSLSTPVDNGDGTWAATLTAPNSTTPPIASISFTVGGITSEDTALVAFVPGIPDPDTSTISAAPDTATADGSSASTITVNLFDGFGNTVATAGDVVTIFSDRGTVSGVTNNNDGTYTASVTSISAGPARLTFTVDGVLASPETAITFVPGTADATTSKISVTPTTITANGVATAMALVTVLDARGNQLPGGGLDVRISSTLGTIGSIIDNGDGTYAALVISAPSPGIATLSFTLAGSPGTQTTNVEFVRSVPDAGFSLIDANPVYIGSEPGDVSIITATLYDELGVRVTHGGDTAEIQSTFGSLGLVTDLGDGRYTASLSSRDAGTATVSLKVNGQLSPNQTSVIILDTTPPDQPTILAPSNGDEVRPIFLIEGTGEPSATVTVLAGTNILCTATVEVDSTWKCRVGTPQAPGALSLRAFQTDPAGNEGEASPATNVTVTRSGPDAPVPNPTNGATISGSAEPRSTVYVSIEGGAAVCSAAVSIDGQFTCSVSPPLALGTLLTFVAVDNNGNVSPPAMVRVGGASLGLSSQTVFLGDTQIVTGIGFLPGEDVSGTVFSNPMSLGSQKADGDGSVVFSFVAGPELGVGIHTVKLTGNYSGTVTVTFEVMATPVQPPAAPPAVGDYLVLTGTPFPIVGIIVGLVLVSGGIWMLPRRRRLAGRGQK